jgi:hypothetical protein
MYVRLHHGGTIRNTYASRYVPQERPDAHIAAWEPAKKARRPEVNAVSWKKKKKTKSSLILMVIATSLYENVTIFL